MNLGSIMKSRRGVIIFSIILGLGLGTMFQRVCKGRGCIIYTAPQPNKIKGDIYKHDDKCYKYDTENVNCESSKNIIE